MDNDFFYFPLGLVILFGAYLLTTKGQKLSFSLGDIFTLTEAALIAFGNTILGKIASNIFELRLVGQLLGKKLNWLLTE